MPEESLTQPADDGGTPAPMQRRTLLQIALAATAGGLVSSSAVAQATGHPAALSLLLDRVTNFASNTGANDIRYNHIWLDLGERNDWFDDLQDISDTVTAPISGTVTPLLGGVASHPGVAVPTGSLSQSNLYAETIKAMQVVKGQIGPARLRIQRLLMAVEREAYWYAYQVGYRSGYEAAKQAGSGPFSATMSVPMVVNDICNIHNLAHDPTTNHLEEPEDNLFKEACGQITGHVSY